MKDIVKNVPVATFYYAGTNEKPIKRTILVVSSDDTSITGIELRRGSRTISAAKNSIKTFLRKKIAKPSRDIPAGANEHTSLRRTTVLRALLEGI